MSNFKLFNENCIDVLSSIEEESIDLVVCDPPYKITQRGNTVCRGFLNEVNGLNGNGGFTENRLNIDEYLPLLYKVMKHGTHGYLMTNDKNLVDFHLSLQQSNFHVIKTLIWYKNNAIFNQLYMNCHEYIVFFRKGNSKPIKNIGTKGILEFSTPKNKIHPSQKPISLLKTLIENSSNKGDTVLDFTMGSGSTGVACKELDRKFIGIEIDKKFFDLASKRIIGHEYTLSLF